MAPFHYCFRVTFASVALWSATALSIIFVSSTFTNSASAANKAMATKNFAAKCEQVYSDRSVKSLAIEETLSYQQICVCARTNRMLRQQLGAAGISCTNTRITNFNQAVATPGPGPDPDPGPGPGPGPDPDLKGNNGWGNGAEGINSGSFKGKTAESKSTDNKGTGVR